MPTACSNGSSHIYLTGEHESVLTNLAYINHAEINSWNQRVLCNEGSFLINETTEAFDGARTHESVTRFILQVVCIGQVMVYV